MEIFGEEDRLGTIFLLEINMVKTRFTGLLVLTVLLVPFTCAMDVAPRSSVADQEEYRHIEMQKQITEQTVLMGALARRMDEAFRSLDQVNGVLTRLDRRVDDLELYMRRLLADKMAASK